MIRSVRLCDASALAGLYNYYIANTVFTLEAKPVSEEAFALRIARISEKYPFLVYEDDLSGKILGYAYLSHFNERYSYRFSADLSIYVANGAGGRGIGTALWEKIKAEAIRCGYFRLISVITDENDASRCFHEHLGFSEAGHLYHVAWKFDHWLGIYHYVISLREGNPASEPIQCFPTEP